MNTKVNDNRLAFLLALSELDIPLSESEKQTLVDIGDQLDVEPEAWESFTEPLLLSLIESNFQLKQHYQFYRNKLESVTELPINLLSTDLKNQLFSGDNFSQMKGLKFNAQPTGYSQQINNAVIVISRSDNPEEEARKLSSLEKMKQYLS